MSDVHIYFDLETTGLDTLTSEILQIGAVHENGTNFMCYIIPQGEIDKGASNVNGITKQKGKLYKYGKLNENAVHPSNGLQGFLDWINYYNQNGNRVILIGHNSVQFDAPILMNNAIANNVADGQDLCDYIWGFSDTLQHFTEQFTFRKNSQQFLMRKFGMVNSQSHDALQDAKDLKELARRAALRLRTPTHRFVGQYTYTGNIAFQTKMSDVHIYFALKTTGFNTCTSEILQIGAVHKDGTEFMCYIIPTNNINKAASNVNGITKQNGKLYKYGNLIENAVHPSDGLRGFLDWINYYNQNGNRVILIGHNSVRFDAPILMNNAFDNNVADDQEMCDYIWGFSDTLRHFRKQFKFSKYSQQFLMCEFGMVNSQSQDALQDAKDLKELARQAALKLRTPTHRFVGQYTYTGNIA